MNQSNEESKEKNEEQKKSLQSDDKEVIENRKPKEGSGPISDAGKKRDEGKRYQ